jgi:carbon-monoxide dehydrogenase medium subunit
MKSPPFSYVQAESVEHASALLGEHADDAKVLAGGQSLLPILNLRLAHPGVLVDIGRIAGLRELEREGDGLLCGALVTHRTLELGLEPALGEFESLSRIAGLIGHLPIRTRGTIGGSLAHGDSASEWALASLVLDAVIIAESGTGRRRIPASGFFHGLFTTDLKPDELLVAVEFPRVPRATRLEEYARRAGDFAIVAAAADLLTDSGSIRQVRIALGGVAGAPVRVPEAEAILTGLDVYAEQEVDAGIREAAHICSVEIEPTDDVHASTMYRRRLTRVLVERALRGCVQDQREVA